MARKKTIESIKEMTRHGDNGTVNCEVPHVKQEYTGEDIRPIVRLIKTDIDRFRATGSVSVPFSDRISTLLLRRRN